MACCAGRAVTFDSDSYRAECNAEEVATINSRNGTNGLQPITVFVHRAGPLVAEGAARNRLRAENVV